MIYHATLRQVFRSDSFAGAAEREVERSDSFKQALSRVVQVFGVRIGDGAQGRVCDEPSSGRERYRLLGTNLESAGIGPMVILIWIRIRIWV